MRPASTGCRAGRTDPRDPGPSLADARASGSSSRTCRSSGGSSRSATEFVDNLSHELRTPLSTVSLLAETLAREAEAAGDGVPPKMRDRIGKIEVETGHLVQMVNELLDLARIEGGGRRSCSTTSTSGGSRSSPPTASALFADRQGLRAASSTCRHACRRVRGDEARLGQVVVNLVHNALKFSRRRLDDDERDRRSVAATGRPTRSASRSDDGDEVTLRSRTTASGSDGRPGPDLRALLQGRSGAGRAAAGRVSGSAIARHVIQQHGGRIWVESEEGRGSTFTFALPVVAGAVADRRR